MLISATCWGQTKPQSDSYEKAYERRIRQEVLYGVYIPKDVNEAILQLNKLIDEKSKTKFRNMPEEQAAHKLFFSLGRWMSYNWSFYDGSRLSYHLQQMGIYHPDDMSRFLIIVFHRSLNKKPLEIKQLLQTFQEKQALEKQERLKKGAILHEERRKKDPPANGKGGNER